jgi:predicted RNA-binding Zn-ribbon protein involved in translation (DUF1610 family)
MGKRTWTDEDLEFALRVAASGRELAYRLGLRTNSGIPRILRYADGLGLDTSRAKSRGAARRVGVPLVSDDELAWVVASSRNVSDVLRRCGYAAAGGSHANVSARIKRLKLDTSHFRVRFGGATSYCRREAADILVVLPDGSFRAKAELLRRALVEVGVPYECSSCGLGPEWNGCSLTLQVEHKDGNRLNCLRENLCFLCPNCHTQTPTYARKKGLITAEQPLEMAA